MASDKVLKLFYPARQSALHVMKSVELDLNGKRNIWNAGIASEKAENSFESTPKICSDERLLPKWVFSAGGRRPAQDQPRRFDGLRR